MINQKFQNWLLDPASNLLLKNTLMYLLLGSYYKYSTYKWAYLVLDHTVHSIFERYQKVRVIGTLEYLKNISNLHST